MRGLRVIFSTSLRRCEKYDFEQPSNVFPMFFDFEGLDFGAERVDFSGVFSKALWRGTFFNFGSNSGPNGSPNGSQNRDNIDKKAGSKIHGFLVHKGWARTAAPGSTGRIWGGPF